MFFAVIVFVWRRDYAILLSHLGGMSSVVKRRSQRPIGRRGVGVTEPVPRTINRPDRILYRLRCELRVTSALIPQQTPVPFWDASGRRKIPD